MLGQTTFKLWTARSSFVAITAFIALGAVAACSPAKWHETKNVQEAPAPFTGDPRAETQTTENTKKDFEPGDEGFVNSDRLCAKSKSNPDEECPSVIEQGDRLRVTDNDAGPDLVEVEVEETKRHDKPIGPVLVPPQYLSKKPIRLTAEQSAADRYFVVQNVATEKLRVYENCGAKDCRHRLVFETDMVVGQNTSSRRTLLGSYTITKWFKFYEDNANKYSSWYSPSAPELPGAGASIEDWTSPSLVPSESKGKLRGAFGWYTAFIGPNADEQWTHGTWGWGADGSEFIDKLRQSPLDADKLLASHGCTRVENQAIALMRDILPPGTKVIKIYARETTAAPVSEAKPQPVIWDWALTSDGVDELNGSSAGLSSSQAQGAGKVLEQGQYTLDTVANAVTIAEAGATHNGNVYGIPQKSFSGVFVVDEGRLMGYRHPRELKVGGHKDKHLPSVVLQSR